MRVGGGGAESALVLSILADTLSREVVAVEEGDHAVRIRFSPHYLLTLPATIVLLCQVFFFCARNKYMPSFTARLVFCVNYLYSVQSFVQWHIYCIQAMSCASLQVSRDRLEIATNTRCPTARTTGSLGGSPLGRAGGWTAR